MFGRLAERGDIPTAAIDLMKTLIRRAGLLADQGKGEAALKDLD